MQGVGKLTNEQLKQVILSGITPTRDDVVLRPGIGVDCGAIRAGGRICVFSSDPITAASQDAGKLAVHVSLNDVAAAGAEPVGLLLTVMAPPGTAPARLGELVRQAQEESAALNVEIIGGHTEFTDAVTRIVLCTTAIGLADVDGRVFSAAGAKPGDELVLTKWAGMEGTAIIASDLPEFAAAHLTAEEAEFARGLARSGSRLYRSTLNAFRQCKRIVRHIGVKRLAPRASRSTQRRECVVR
jgi:hydrogenase maturation factor